MSTCRNAGALYLVSTTARLMSGVLGVRKPKGLINQG
jgi:hypothetical protein